MRLKMISILCASCLLVGLGIFCLVVNQQDKQRDKEYREWQESVLSLDVQCRDIEKKIKKLEEDYQNQAMPKSTTQVLFTDLNEKVYTECFPIIQEYGYTGTLAVTSKQLPGKEGCMTLEQYSELIENGWDVCVQWESPTNVNRWWRDLKKEMEKLEINYEKVIYFPHGTYKTSLDTRIRQMEFEIVISEKLDKESPLQNQYEEGIWHIYGMGSMTKQPKKWLKEAVAQKANVVFLVSFELEHQLYNKTSFTRMLGSFEECVVGRELLVCNVNEAREHYRIRQNGVDAEIEKKYQERKEILEKQLEETKKELEKINALY